MRVFFRRPSRGNLHVLLSSSVPLILPLIWHCPRVRPRVQTHTRTDSGQQSRGYQSMKWKKKTNPLWTEPSVWAAQHLIQLIKWLISCSRWSVVQTMLWYGGGRVGGGWGGFPPYTHTLGLDRRTQLEREKQIILVLAAQVYTVDNSRGLWVMNWKAFN